MRQMTSRERIGRALRLLPVDRIGTFESFWKDTQAAWRESGHLTEDEQLADLADHFALDLRCAGGFNMVADIDAEEQIVEETDETKLVRDGNGALLRWWKSRSGTPEHVDFLVKDRAGWGQHIRPRLTDESAFRKRMDAEGYGEDREKCRREELFFCWGGSNVFECMHPVCGHEYMLMGMALDPDWVKDMCTVYAELIINLMQILFEDKGRPDGIYFFEDMGFKGKPFMSPAMYAEIMQPGHRRLFDYAHSRGRKVLVHSCGYVAPLVPGLIEAGMDCLQAMEVKAGMDLPDLFRQFGDRISFFGNIDVREIASNDRNRIEAEIVRKIPPVLQGGGGYLLHSDHSIPPDVDHDTYAFFMERGRELGRLSWTEFEPVS